MPRSNRRCHPCWGGDWFGGKSSTRIATFFIRLRNSSGNESHVSSATLTNSSRSILHQQTQTRAPALRVAVVFIFILVIFSAVAFVSLFVFFLVGLLSKEDNGSDRAIR